MEKNTVTLSANAIAQIKLWREYKKYRSEYQRFNCRCVGANIHLHCIQPRGNRRVSRYVQKLYLLQRHFEQFIRGRRQRMKTSNIILFMLGCILMISESEYFFGNVIGLFLIFIAKQKITKKEKQAA